MIPKCKVCLHVCFADAAMCRCLETWKLDKTTIQSVETEVYNWGYVSLAVIEERLERQARHIQRW